jgi:hypothetical protein
MRVHIPCTTHMIVIGLRRMEQKYLVSAPLRKAERKTELCTANQEN